MSGTDDLKNLLDRLKDEVGPMPEPVSRPAVRRPVRAFTDEIPPAAPARPRLDRFSRPSRPEFRHEEREPQASGNVIWSENKETMLFGVLTSLIAALGGVLGGIDYLVVIGAAGFVLFSLVTLLALSGHILNSLRHGPAPAGLPDRGDALPKKPEPFAPRGGAPRAGGTRNEE